MKKFVSLLLLILLVSPLLLTLSYAVPCPMNSASGRSPFSEEELTAVRRQALRADADPPLKLGDTLANGRILERALSKDELQTVVNHLREIRAGKIPPPPSSTTPEGIAEYYAQRFNLKKIFNLDTASPETYSRDLAKLFETRYGLPEGSIKVQKPTNIHRRSEVFLLSVEGPEGLKRMLVVKINRVKTASQFFESIRTTFNEITSSLFFKSKKINVPDVIDTAIVNDLSGNPAMMMVTEYAAGTNILSRIDAISALKGMARKIELQALALQLEAVGVEAARINNINPGKVAAPIGDDLQAIQGALSRFAMDGDLDGAVVSILTEQTQLLSEALDASGTIAARIQRGDSHIGNYLVGEKAVAFDFDSSLNSIAQDGTGIGGFRDLYALIRSVYEYGFLKKLNYEEIALLRESILTQWGNTIEGMTPVQIDLVKKVIELEAIVDNYAFFSTVQKTALLRRINQLLSISETPTPPLVAVR